MIQIRQEELVDFKRYHEDDMGYIYKYEGKYIRVIHKNKVRFVKKLFKCGCVKELIDKGFLVNTSISEYYLDDPETELILEHETLDEQLKQYQLCFGMLRDMALLVLNMEIILDKYGLELKDCNRTNISWKDCKPVYIDFGSIAPKKDYWNNGVSRSFENEYLYPLRLMAKGKDELARLYMFGKDKMGFRVDSYAHMDSVFTKSTKLNISVPRPVMLYKKSHYGHEIPCQSLLE